MSQWSEEKLKLVRSVVGMAVGVVLMIAALFFVPDILADGVSKEDLILLALFVVVGFVAAFPSVAHQAVGDAIDAWRNRKGSG